MRYISPFLLALLLVGCSQPPPVDPDPRFEVIPHNGFYTVRYCKTAEPLSTCKPQDLIEEPCIDNCVHFSLPVPPPSKP